MATIDDLPVTSFSELSIEDAHELLRKIRASRLMPPKKKSTKAKKKAEVKKISNPDNMSTKQASELLKLLQSRR